MKAAGFVHSAPDKLEVVSSNKKVRGEGKDFKDQYLKAPTNSLAYSSRQFMLWQ